MWPFLFCLIVSPNGLLSTVIIDGAVTFCLVTSDNPKFLVERGQQTLSVQGYGSLPSTGMALPVHGTSDYTGIRTRQYATRTASHVLDSGATQTCDLPLSGTTSDGIALLSRISYMGELDRL